ncbi:MULTISPECIES: ECs_2282 family putative zinc-binding protein [Clostridium]|uniref:ECs_2282 family putative zinc-binding protein n=1 Tax=Clostridium sp. 3-3 TaxID=2070757 RepID=UPI0015E1B0BC|nr:hypothetical protein [Clostridium sp. 3-3]
MKDMEMNIKLRCSVCGNDQFTALDESVKDINEAEDDIEIKCSDCGRIITKEQLIEENSSLINDNIEDFKDEVIKELDKEISKIFK